MENNFLAALNRKNPGRPPVWFMRQAGRYHKHYRNLRTRHDFTELCKNPALACEVTMGPIEEFDFDAAILFSDILFPLEAMGMGLTFDPAPRLSFLLSEGKNAIKKLKGGKALAQHMSFQAEALQQIKANLGNEKGLIGFVGAPLTLFYFAAVGTHKKDLTFARQGVENGLFAEFSELLTDLLAENMLLQAQAGADVVAVFDTCAGDLPAEIYGKTVVPVLKNVLAKFKKGAPQCPIIYYSKGTSFDHWAYLEELPIDCLGIDWKNDLVKTLAKYGKRWAIQGNFDPSLLAGLAKADLEKELNSYFSVLKNINESDRQSWICGLGHGVLPQTPEENVKAFLSRQKGSFGAN